jgi:hypothetical protein
MKKYFLSCCACMVMSLYCLGSAAQATEGERISARGRTMMIAGWASLAGGYAASLVVGMPVFVYAVDPCGKPENEGNDLCGVGATIYMALMAVPLVGPAIVAADMFRYGDAGEKGFGAFMLIDSLVQVAGLAVAIAGHVTFAKGQKLVRKGGFLRPGYDGGRFSLFAAPFGAAGGGGIGVTGQF